VIIVYKSVVLNLIMVDFSGKLVPKTKQKKDDRTDNQEFYYESLSGLLLGSKAREALILEEFENIKKKDKFLEVGCAQGYYLRKALKKTKNVYGFDVVEDFIKVAKKNVKGAKVSVDSATKMHYKKDEFNYVLCTEVLEHVPNYQKAVKEIKRVLRKKGRAIITVPLEHSLFWRAFSLIYPPEEYRGHINLVTAKEVENEFLKNGFNLVKKEFIHSPSRTLNKILPQKEGIAMYSFFVFEK
jgi:SAM-dependent methyltransferase